MDTRFLSISEGSFRCIKFFESMSPASNISEELARFKVWVGNIGACEEGFDSLDDRLFDAPHLWYQILDLLEDLWRCLLDGKTPLTTSMHTPANQMTKLSASAVEN